jgi:PAS domain-containing protein
LAAAHYGIFICTADGVLKTVNAAFEKLTGHSAEELVGVRTARLPLLSLTTSSCRSDFDAATALPSIVSRVEMTRTIRPCVMPCDVFQLTRS